MNAFAIPWQEGELEHPQLLAAIDILTKGHLSLQRLCKTSLLKRVNNSSRIQRKKSSCNPDDGGDDDDESVVFENSEEEDEGIEDKRNSNISLFSLSNRKRRKRAKFVPAKSRNPVIHEWLSTEVDNDDYADLEDFIVE